MIARYCLPDMAAVWNEDTRFAKWLEVELAVADALAEIGEIPGEAAKVMRRTGRVDAEEIAEIEKTTDHDVIAFIKFQLPGSFIRRHVFSLTTQWPPFLGPIRSMMPDSRNFRRPRSTVLLDVPILEAKAALESVLSVLSKAIIASDILSDILSDTSSDIFTGVFSDIFVWAVNCTISPDASERYAGSGTPAALHSWRIFSMPRPQDSIIPARKKALAMRGLNGLEACLANNCATVH